MKRRHAISLGVAAVALGLVGLGASPAIAQQKIVLKATDVHPLAYVCDAGYCRNWNYKWYRYTGARIQGTTTFGPNAEVGYGSWPLKRGLYEIRLLADDGYRLLAVSAPFRVIAGG